jgi:hypothetical protein
MAYKGNGVLLIHAQVCTWAYTVLSHRLGAVKIRLSSLGSVTLVLSYYVESLTQTTYIEHL